ncbi:Gfo/Idh/MocA family protein [Timonella senegalensis]|uniref:Gfo/Idh/MocA family protein n=1 Tax=Timonella senegalensis TaxID=1465825 RepID=UPI0028B18372|nr:Gfo/Idh/MocA family oxidoreductase [Timonella senegalensis]
MENNIIPSALTSGLVPSPADAPAVRWGILGAGWISSRFAQAVSQRTASTIAAVGSRSAERADAFIAANLEGHPEPKVYTTYEELVADPDIDAIYVGTPHSHHLEHGLLAINAGKHVLVEKALTRNAGEARELLDAARDNGVFIMEAMWTRFLPHVAAVHDLIDRGVIGEITTVIADHGQHFEFNAEHRLYNPDLAGGALLDLGIYPLSFAHDILGAPTEIVARGQLTETNVDGQISMILDYPGRQQASLSTTLWGATPTTASITGTLGRIEIDGAFYAPTSFTVTLNDGTTSRYEKDDALGLEFEAAEVARCIAEGKLESERITREQSYAIMEAMDQIRSQVGVVYPGE